MKNILISVLAIALVISVSLNVVYTNKIMNKSSDFFRKQECQKLQAEIEKRLKNTYSSALLYSELDKIFYSPVKDSCLYTYRVRENNVESNPNFYLKDALTNDELYSVIISKDTEILRFGNLMEEFNRVVSKYVDPDIKESDLPKSGTIRF